jgi:hypothetical protein
MDNNSVIKFLSVAQHQFNKNRMYFLGYYWNNNRKAPKILEDETRKDVEAFDRVRKILQMQEINWNVE